DGSPSRPRNAWRALRPRSSRLLSVAAHGLRAPRAPRGPTLPVAPRGTARPPLRPLSAELPFDLTDVFERERIHLGQVKDERRRRPIEERVEEAADLLAEHRRGSDR